MNPAPKPAPSLVIEEARQWIRKRPCLLAHESPCTCAGFLDVVRRVIVSESAHVRTRRNNGDVAQLVPLCKRHHAEQHRLGIRSFEDRHREGLGFRTLASHADELWAVFQAETGYQG